MLFKYNYLNFHYISNTHKEMKQPKRYIKYCLDKTKANARTEKFDFSLINKIPFFSNISKDQISITLFKSFTNNKNYKITVQDKHYVLRVPEHKVDIVDKINRRNEKINFEIAANLELCPHSIYFDATTGIQLRPFIEGTVLTPQILTKTDIIGLSNILKKAHTSKQPFANDIVVHNLFKRYESILKINKFSTIHRLKTLFQMTDEIIKVLALYPVYLTPCHFDPHPANFIKSNQKLFLLDWEFSGNIDPAWDLAFLSTSSNFDQEEDEILLKNYYGDKLTTIDKNRMLITKPLTEFFVTARMSCILSIQHDAQLQKLQEASFAKTESLYNDETFQEALTNLRKNFCPMKIF